MEMDGSTSQREVRTEGNTTDTDEAKGDEHMGRHHQLEYKDQVGPSAVEPLQQQQQQTVVNNRNTLLIPRQANIELIEDSDDSVLNVDNMTMDTDPTHQHVLIAREYPSLEQQQSNSSNSGASTITTSTMISTVSGLTTGVTTDSSIPIANQVHLVTESEQERRLLHKIERLRGALLRTGVPLDTVEEMLNDADDWVSQEETSIVFERISHEETFTVAAATRGGSSSSEVVEQGTLNDDTSVGREQHAQLPAAPNQSESKRDRKWLRFRRFWLVSILLATMLAWIEFPVRWSFSSTPRFPGEEHLSCKADTATSTFYDDLTYDRASRILQYLQQETLSDKTLHYNTASSDPSDQALTWLIDTDPLQLSVEDNPSHLLQRFALLTFIFSQGSGAVLQGSSTPPLHECDGTYLQLEAPLWVCDHGHGIVREITTGSIGLWGSLPADLGLLTHVSVLDFSKNRLEGTIPATIGLLTALRVLDLQKNQLRGTIPTELSLLEDLEFVRLNDNQLSGTIPSTLLGKRLQMLRLSRNRLRGTVPAAMGMLTHLDILWLQGNQLTGTLSATLTNLSPRDALFFDNPGLSGRIPFCDSAMHPKTTLIADCDRVDCPCCSYCCPNAKDGIPSTILCHQ